jgi:hypothetical protein
MVGTSNQSDPVAWPLIRWWYPKSCHSTRFLRVVEIPNGLRKPPWLEGEGTVPESVDSRFVESRMIRR